MGGPIHVSKSVDWGKNHHNEFKKKFGKHLGLGICGDDLPEESNYVELDPILKDSNGIPSPKINYKVSKNSRKLLAHGLKNAEIVLKEAGASEIIKSAHDSEAGWHLMGTARMGKDPKNSVVNENCQSHDLENLFIVDGSVFVTAQGEMEAMKKFVGWCYKGPPGAIVRNVGKVQGKTEEFSEFIVVY